MNYTVTFNHEHLESNQILGNSVSRFVDEVSYSSINPITDRHSSGLVDDYNPWPSFTFELPITWKDEPVENDLLTV